MIQKDDAIGPGTMTYRADGSAHDTADIVTDEQIDRLHTEAGNVRDEAQVRLCERALDDDKEARRECARVIQAALAMVD